MNLKDFSYLFRPKPHILKNKGFRTITSKISDFGAAIILIGLIFAPGSTSPVKANPGSGASHEHLQAVQSSTTIPANNDPSVETPYDDYYAAFFAHPWDIPEEAADVNAFWIEVDLNNQILYAYRGDRIINAFLISSGAGTTPTETGTFKIYAKYDRYNMTGPDYEYPDVPYTMFFYKGYSIHGTYWHNNFGTPMSFGCVNMKTEDAAWIYENAPVGTYVFIHY